MGRDERIPINPWLIEFMVGSCIVNCSVVDKKSSEPPQFQSHLTLSHSFCCSTFAIYSSSENVACLHNNANCCGTLYVNTCCFHPCSVESMIVIYMYITNTFKTVS